MAIGHRFDGPAPIVTFVRTTTDKEFLIRLTKHPLTVGPWDVQSLSYVLEFGTEDLARILVAILAFIALCRVPNE